MPVLSLFVQPAYAEGDERVTLRPSSSWALDYGENRCRIVRTFGDEEEKTIFYLEQRQPSDNVTWVVGGALVEQLHAKYKFTVKFGPGFAPFEIKPKVAMTLGEFGDAISGYGFKEQSEDQDESAEAQPVGLPVLEVDQGKAVDWIEISRGSKTYRLNTGNLGPVFEAMNSCMLDLVKFWGADPEILRKRKTLPKVTNLGKVARMVQEHFPSDALRKRAQADLLIRVLVEADGTASKCFIHGITNAEQFDNEACVVFLEAAKFEPALDMDGRPVASYYINRILYRVN